MKIIIFFLVSFLFVFGNIDDLLGDFESAYKTNIPKKTMSNAFNKNMVQKSTPMKKYITMEKMPPKENMSSISMAIKNQQSMNKQEDISIAINMAIEEYLDSIIPLVSLVGLFSFIAIVMYMLISSMSSSSLGKKVEVLEKFTSNKIKKIEKEEDVKYDELMDHIKSLNSKVEFLELMVEKIWGKEKQTTYTKQPVIKNEDKPKGKVPKEEKQYINKDEQKDTKKDVQKDTKKDVQEDIEEDFFVDDNFAMDESDEELNLNNTSNNKKEKNTTPVSDLSNLDMDIKPISNKKTKTKTESMEDFSLDDFDE